MSFLRNIRNNLTTGHKAGTAQRNGKLNPGPPTRSIISERTAATPRKPDSTDAPQRDRSDYGTYGGRRNSDYSRRGSTSTTLRRESKYGKETPAPIIVFVDKYETTKKPAGILRNNTFTKGDRDKERRSGNAISRSDTFTINESENEENMKTNTYTKRKSKERSRENITDPTEKLPVVVDSRTYRKKSLKSSKPVQKVESFIKRFEKSLFRNDSKKHDRKDSNSSNSTYIPTFRDIGINCKLDEEEKLKTRKKRQSSRESLLDTANVEYSSSSQQSYRDRSATPQNKSRERSTSPTKKYSSTYDRMEKLPERNESPSINGRSKMTHERSSSPFETLQLKSKPTDNSYLKARQKEIEMGYSTINKRPSLTLTRSDTPDRNRSVLVNTTRTERYDSDQGRTVTTSTHRVEYNQRPTTQFHSNTYNTLKKEYEQANSKPVGIASPRLNSDRPRPERSASPSKQSRKDSGDIPKYTFGTNLVERRSRFQEFQKSFRKNDDAEATYQQRFFVPI
ncbi:splicing regulatory glutamine/lysine-rich protein 1-like [Toxorhynchites rutilus septentrionalis]|uniref:splicing regulatory glutamine/lysine-rich protein 1-like n=1 Tax=Toxorhynchites rutilus septentrionalis TaxID=329112 RepID=UPI00247992D2|nr:splicing regulatory glutamine/lysine-rich protein 1-like [Toxorhynchites rutilus septentrionalis]